jgi:preprotein translocase subunit SecD
MGIKIRNRAIITAAVLMLCVFGIICYPVGEQEFIGFPRNYQRLKENIRNRIRLGLDLKGGTHLVLQVLVEDAVNITNDLTRERLADELRAKNIPYADVQKVDSTHILIKGIPQEKSSDVQTLASEQFPDWDFSREAGDPLARRLMLKNSAAAAIRSQALEQSRNTIRNRIDQLGVTEPTIADYGGPADYELVVQLPGVDDPGRVKDIIQSTAMLTLKIVQDGPYASREAALAAHGGILPPDSELLPGRRESGSEGQGGEAWYIVNRIAAVTGRDLRDAQPRTDENGRPSVNFNLTRDGAIRFGRVTGQNIGKQLAIILDNRVIDAPSIQSQITDSGRISPLPTMNYASDLALVLRSGALPASIKYLEERTVGPSLGADSIRHGVVASIVGLMAVMGFMLFYYRGAGINANLALILNVIILVAALAYFGAVLTLPGIAGVILTVGMGVDSNVLIFERIREELRMGKTVGAAVAGGFDHAFVTIIDTHVTTIVSAMILFTFGTGPIRGFAVTLTIGLLANLFTSVFVSRTIFDYVLTQRQKGDAISI